MQNFVVIGRYERRYCTTIKKGKSKETLTKRLNKEGWSDFTIRCYNAKSKN